MNKENLNNEYVEFYLKFLEKEKDLREDFDKLREPNKERFVKELGPHLAVSMPGLLQFIKNNIFY